MDIFKHKESITLRIKYQIFCSISRYKSCQQTKVCGDAVPFVQDANPSPRHLQVGEDFWKGLNPVAQVLHLAQHKNMIGNHAPHSCSDVLVV